LPKRLVLRLRLVRLRVRLVPLVSVPAPVWLPGWTLLGSVCSDWTLRVGLKPAYSMHPVRPMRGAQHYSGWMWHRLTRRCPLPM
jgi:hypothetical protein